MFYIGFIDSTKPYRFYPRNESFIYDGELIINDYRHVFYASVMNQPGHWQLKDYQRQWRAGIERLQTHRTSCLVLHFWREKKKHATQVLWLYRKGDKVLVHFPYHCEKGQSAFMKPPLPYTPENCYSAVPSYPFPPCKQYNVWWLPYTDLLAYLSPSHAETAEKRRQPIISAEEEDMRKHKEFLKELKMLRENEEREAEGHLL